MRIFVTGGGSAGHVTPILAVAADIKRLTEDSEIIFIRQIGDRETSELIVAQGSDVIDRVIPIAAGKFRRYHGVAWWKQALDIPMQLKNIRDSLYFVLGIMQSLMLMLIKRPDVVFVKGGYVGLPVGLVASAIGVPLVIHESDTHMGLTNKILSSKASAIGLGVPKKYFQLDNQNTYFVGVPVSKDYRKVTTDMQIAYKKELGIEPGEPLVVITGGSNGAQRINNMMIDIAPALTKKAQVIHQTGRETYEQTKNAIEQSLSNKLLSRYRLVPFIEKDMHIYLGAADVVVTRVGTTTMSELALSAKPLILIPNPKLVYGHQLKNARMYKDAQAAIVMDEAQLIDSPKLLLEALEELLESPEEQKVLAINLSKMAKPEASEDIARLIISSAK